MAFVRDIGISNHWGLSMTPGQDANDNILGIFFDLLDKNGMLSVLIRIALMRQF